MVPPIAHAASPVVAVTNTECLPCFTINFSTIESSKVLFPVPAPPVKKMFSPAKHAVIIFSCSSVRTVLFLDALLLLIDDNFFGAISGDVDLNLANFL